MVNMGGVINPLIAFGACYWLATSVLLQKTELADTRKALEASQEAQQQHADTALLAARIPTINIRLSMASGMLKHHRQRRNDLYTLIVQKGAAYLTFDESGSTTTVSQVLDNTINEIELLVAKEVALLSELDVLSRSVP